MPSRFSCSICGSGAGYDADFAQTYPGLTCRECDERALNADGKAPRRYTMNDDGDNPVFIDGIKCWRRYRFGGFVTMRGETMPEIG